MIRHLKIFSLIFFTTVFFVEALWADSRSESTDIKQAEHELLVNKPLEAMRIITRYHKSIEEGSPLSEQWLNLLVRASIDTANLEQLTYLFEYSPQIFNKNEKAALLLSDALLQKDDKASFRLLRSNWRGKESEKGHWLLLDADYLLANGNKQEAITLLKSTSLVGEKEGERYFRLAVLYSGIDLNQSWNYLSESLAKNPNNPEIRAFRGQMLESMGHPQSALKEYRAAAALAPANVFFKDQLAEAYVTSHHYPAAILAWEEAVERDPLDFLLVKLYFWKKVTSSQPLTGYHPKISQKSEFSPLLNYFSNLPANRFWDGSLYKQIVGESRLSDTLESLLWLQVIDALENGNENQAANLLAETKLKTLEWGPDLSAYLQQIIQFRQTGSWPDQLLPLEESEGHPFFVALAEHRNGEPFPEDIERLLQGGELFSALFLAAGWNEVAIALNKQETSSYGLPDWYVAEFTEALKENRSGAAALAFAKQQQPSPELSLLVAELLIDQGNKTGGMQLLERLAAQNNSVSLRAANLLVNEYLDHGEYQVARELVLRDKNFENSVIGKEVLARIALSRGDTAEATKVYNSIEGQSAEAKSFLARQAYARQDWQKALLLTEQLLEIYPENKLLCDNLRCIQQQTKSVYKGRN